jgi:hypothetical protein
VQYTDPLYAGTGREVGGGKLAGAGQAEDFWGLSLGLLLAPARCNPQKTMKEKRNDYL